MLNQYKVEPVHETRTPDGVEAIRSEPEAKAAPRVYVGNRLDQGQVEALEWQLQQEEGSRIVSSKTKQGQPETILAGLIEGARRRQAMTRIAIGAYVMLVAMMALRYLAFSGRWDPHAAALILACASFGGAMLWLWIKVRAALSPIRWSRSRRSSGCELYDDIRLVGPLADALPLPNPEVVLRAEAALTSLLPRMGVLDARLLNREQRECIYRNLLVRNIGAKPDFLVAILGFVERLSDTRPLPEVLALAFSTIDTADGRKVKAAAETCLQVLRQTEVEKDERKSLLRGSSSGITPPGELVRPVELSGDTSVDELLRANHADEQPID